MIGAIQTTFRPATDHHGSRILAKCRASRTNVWCAVRTSIPYDHARSSFENHQLAARILADKNGETRTAPKDFVSAESVDGRGYVFIQLPEILL